MFGANQPGMKRTFGDGPADSWQTKGPSDEGSAEERRKKRRSRWNTDLEDKTVIPGMPTVIPADLSESQQRQYVVHLQIEEISRKLRSGDLGIPANPEQRSPSPEPIYNNEGKRLNTREYRTRKKLEEERHKLIQEAMKLNTDFKPPSDYKPPIIRVSDKVMIPQEEHPDINFVGLLIGPRGNTLKTLEKDTGAKIIIRGKGSVKDGKIGRKDGQPLPGEDEPLHAYVTANNPENVKKAVERIKDIIRQGIEVPEGQNDLRRQQLRELALLNGTLRENDGLAKLRQIAESQTIVTNTIVCTVCGGTGHIAQDCKQKRPGDTFRMQQMQNPAERAKMDSEYMSLMAELGEGPPPPKNEPPPNQPHYGRPSMNNPPPNPMGMNSPWQMGNRALGPPPGPLLSRPPMGGMQQHQQGGPPPMSSANSSHGGGPMGGRMPPMPLLSTPIQPPPGVAPHNDGTYMGKTPLLGPPPGQQPQQQMGGMLQQQQQQQQQQGPQQGSMLRPWQQQQAQQQPPSLMASASQPPQLMGNPVASSAPSMGVPPPPPSVLAPPPPPPNSSQTQMSNPPWMQQAGKQPQGALPPPPPPPPPTSSPSTSAPGSGRGPGISPHLLDIQTRVMSQQQQQQNPQGPGQSHMATPPPLMGNHENSGLNFQHRNQYNNPSGVGSNQQSQWEDSQNSGNSVQMPYGVQENNTHAMHPQMGNRNFQAPGNGQSQSIGMQGQRFNPNNFHNDGQFQGNQNDNIGTRFPNNSPHFDNAGWRGGNRPMRPQNAPFNPGQNGQSNF